MNKDVKAWIGWAMVGLFGSLAVACADGKYEGAHGSEPCEVSEQCAPSVKPFVFEGGTERTYGYTYSGESDTTYFVTFEARGAHGEVVGIDSLTINKSFYTLLDGNGVYRFYTHVEGLGLVIDSVQLVGVRKRINDTEYVVERV